MSLNPYVHNSPQLNLTLRNALVTYRNALRDNIENVLPHAAMDATEKVQVTAKATQELQSVTVQLQLLHNAMHEKTIDHAELKTPNGKFQIL